MKVLIAYNKNTGEILYTQSGGSELEDNILTNLSYEVPDGKIIKSVNIETKEPVLDDIPKTDIEKLQEQVASLTQANAELTSIVATMETTNA
ncbi:MULTISPECIES: hypothetical protein [Clostridium]|uniref:hypothetical protein n=1 Tax=Clostridium TaxID=1485 RepID=UPI001EF18E1E|nr:MULTISPECIES: hypothetical protein [Clostridium]